MEECIVMQIFCHANVFKVGHEQMHANKACFGTTAVLSQPAIAGLFLHD